MRAYLGQLRSERRVLNGIETTKYFYKYNQVRVNTDRMLSEGRVAEAWVPAAMTTNLPGLSPVSAWLTRRQKMAARGSYSRAPSCRTPMSCSVQWSL